MTAPLAASEEALLACPAGPLCSVVAQLPETLPIAAAEAGAVFAWYSLPDVVRSRPLRTVAKVGLMGGILALEAWRNRETINYVRDVLAGDLDEDAACEECCEPAVDALTVDEAPSPRALLLAGLAIPLGIASVTAVVGERWLFRRGERRRAAGVRNAHTRQAACLSGLTAAMVVADSLLFSGQMDEEESSSCCQ